MTKLTQKECKGTKTFYLPRSRSNSRPEVTVIVAKEKDRYIFGFAICNPKDNFCKALGRRIAYNRMRFAPIVANSAMALQAKLFTHIQRIAKRRPLLLEKVPLSEVQKLSNLDKYFE